MAKPNKNTDRVRKVCAQYGYEYGCIVPGCDRPVILHHMVRRVLGGTDAISNMMAICHKHEKPLHAAGGYARKSLK